MSNLSMNGSTVDEMEEEKKVEEDEEEIQNIDAIKCMDTVTRYIPILKWFPKYTQLDAVSDLIAGITLGLTMIPQSIAYAALAGLTAQYGLYSAFAGSLIYIFFGTIKEVSIGPTSLMSLLTIEYTRDMPLEFVVLLGFLAGCIELLFGLLNLGFLVDFISIPVVSGFTSATSVIIIISQLQGLFGLKFKSSSNIDSVTKVFQNIEDIQIEDTLIGISSIIFLLLFRKIDKMNMCGQLNNKRSKIVKKSLWLLAISRNALLILITTIIAFTMEKDGKTPFILSGKVKSGLPSISLPPFNTQVGNQTYTFMDMCSYLGSGFIVLPLIAVLANVSIAKAFASGKTVDASQEMRSLGLCNIFGSFVQSMPTCGAFSRSAVSNASGVRTPLSGLYAGVMTLLALSFLTPYFYYIPRASLAAVLIAAVIFMIDWTLFPILWKGSKKDLIATVGTFIACILSVEFGLLFGVILNIIYLLHAWARPSIQVMKCKTTDGDEYIQIKPDIGIYYPAVDFLRAKINEVAIRKGKNILPLVLDCYGFRDIDYTALKGIETMVNDFDKKGQHLLFINLNAKLLKKIEMFGGIKKLKNAENQADIIDKLFGNIIQMTRSPTIPILKQVKDEIAENKSPVTNKFEKYPDDHKGEQDRESLLNEHETAMKQFTVVKTSESKDD